MLKAEISVPAGLAVATMVYAIHTNATPTAADIRALPEGNDEIDRAERTASWLAAGMVSAVSLVAKDPVIFWFGSAAIVGMAWWTRHANRVVPQLKQAVTPSEKAFAGSVTTGPAMETRPMPVMANSFQ